MSGFNLPPGCTVSMLPGNSRGEQQAEEASIALFDALYAATRCGFTVAEVLQEWNDAACEAAHDELEEAAAEQATMAAELAAEEQYFAELEATLRERGL